MLEKILNELIAFLQLRNPDLKGFLHSEQTEFRGLTDKLPAYFFVRSLMNGDKSFKLKERDVCGEKEIEFDFKLIMQTKCFNDCVIPTLLIQLEDFMEFKVQSFSSDTERVYKEETKKELQGNKDIQLYVIYGSIKRIINLNAYLKCNAKNTINLIDCGC